jgi:hypothetical protein
MDGLVGGKAGEADGLAKSRRSGAVGGRSSSVRAGQGSAKGEAHASAWLLREKTPGALRQPSRERTYFP